MGVQASESEKREGKTGRECKGILTRVRLRCEACGRKYATAFVSRRIGVRAEIFIDFGSGNYAPQNEAAPMYALPSRYRGNLSV